MLSIVRVARGLTQAELAQRARISQTEISYWEGQRRMPTAPQLAELSRVLHVPVALLPTSAPDVRVLHRLPSSLPARIVGRINAEMALNAVHLESLLAGVPAADHQPSPRPSDPVGAARALRRAWGVGKGPVPDVVAVVEAHGIVCLLRCLGKVNVAALGNWTTLTRPFVLLDTGSDVRERRLAAAHELGHALMHSQPSASGEAEADAFALEFLMPRAEITSELTGLTRTRLGDLEERWGVPAATIAGYARDLGILTPTRYRTIRAQLLDIGVEAAPPTPERATLVGRVVQRRIDEGKTEAQVASDALLDVGALRRDYLDTRAD